MQRATCIVEGTSQIKFSKAITSPKKEQETDADHEKRVWKERCHTDSNGNVFIPAMMVKNTISNAAAFVSIKIKGGRNQTYTKHFVSGILVLESAPLGVHIDDVEGEWLFVPSDGKKGGSKRVHKCFPVIRNWRAEFQVVVLNELITPEIFAKVLDNAGKYIGFGSFRPQNGGMDGRFIVNKIIWETSEDGENWTVAKTLDFGKAA